ncbi:hypothetical protein DFH29DRAFT_1045725 [Suillus ampliporus]|nr:hypothetical protein DFH29DRAFT_1045725 [Suillus ampliporus]
MSPIHWTLTTGFPETATHIIDFSPGGLNGIGPLTARNIEGRSVCVVTLGNAVSIPSTEKAAEIIGSDGLRKAGTWYMSFKPGLVDSIRQVVNTTKSNPDFPIILQWTGEWLQVQVLEIQLRVELAQGVF